MEAVTTRTYFLTYSDRSAMSIVSVSSLTVRKAEKSAKYDLWELTGHLQLAL